MSCPASSSGIMNSPVHWPHFVVGLPLPWSLSRRALSRTARLTCTALIGVLSVVPTQAATPPVASSPVASSTETPAQDGLITIESDTQSADNVTGVVTALGNVRITYPSRRMVATSRQAQYFTEEGRLVLSGDVDIVQDGGNAVRAERVVYRLDDGRAEAEPLPGRQVFSQLRIRPSVPAGPSQQLP